VPEILKEAPDTILLLVSNPVDVLTYAVRKVSGNLPLQRIIGSGTVLDTSRFRSLLATRLKVAVSNVHAYIVGEHGDSEVPLWSSSHVGNVPLDRFHTETCKLLTDAERGQIFNGVRNAAASVIAAKGATNWAVGLAVERILETIARDDQSVLTVSRFLEDYHGISDVCLSVPGIVNGQGLGPLLPIEYSPVEIEALRHSARILRDVAKELGCCN
jgi:L-lactate dehydrogenase